MALTPLLRRLLQRPLAMAVERLMAGGLSHRLRRRRSVGLAVTVVPAVRRRHCSPLVVLQHLHCLLQQQLVVVVVQHPRVMMPLPPPPCRERVHV